MLEDATSNFGTFKSITGVVCSYLPHIGDDYLVFQMLEKVVVDQIVSWLNLPTQVLKLFQLNWFYTISIHIFVDFLKDTSIICTMYRFFMYWWSISPYTFKFGHILSFLFLRFIVQNIYLINSSLLLFSQSNHLWTTFVHCSECLLH